MDVENLAKELILKNMTPEQQMAVLDSVRESVIQAKEVQKRKIGENVDLVVQALKKIEYDITTRFESVGNSIEKRVLSIKDGRDGSNGKDGRDGKDGKSGKDGLKGDRGLDGQAGRDGVDGVDGISVVNANIDFDGSLVISLSDGREINVGEVVSADVAEKIKVISTMSTNAAIAVKEEGTTLTSGVKSLNFVGTGITATTSGDDVTVTVASGSGTVTSVAATGGTGISVSGSPITTSGTLTITNTAPDQTVVLTAGTGINTSGTYPSFTVTNSAPDQTVSLTASTGITTSGTYPSFTIANSAPDQTVVLTAGTGINTSGTYPNFTITNSAPDQTVALTGAGTTSISGTYPNFTVTSNDAFIGTVTSVSGTSPVSVATGTTTPVISLAANYGDTQNPYASKTANFVLAAPNGSAGVPTFRAVVAADIPTLNQNTTGSAATVTTTINSGVVATTQTAGDNSTKVATTAYVNAITGTNGITGFKNRIINGAMDIAQRGTSFTSTGSANNDDTYVLDRFYILSDGNDIIDVTQTTTVPTGAKYSIGLDVETVNKKFGIAQIIENANCFDAIGGNVTVSFQAKVSATTNLDNIKCAIVAWSGTADTVTSDIISAWGVEGTNPTLIANATYENSPANLNVTTSFATYSVTANVDTASTSNIILFIWSDVTTTSLGEFLYITNIQLEKGSTATSFDYRPYGTELALCQRYFERSYNIGAATGSFTNGFTAFNNPLTSTVDVPTGIKFKVTKRDSPTVIVYNVVSGASGFAYRVSDGASISVSSLNYIGMGGVGTLNLASGSVNNYLIHWVASSEL
jgi:hypothetical protein